MAQTVSRGRPSWRRRDRGRVLSVKLLTTVQANRASTSRELGRGVRTRASGSACGGRDQVGAQGRLDGHAGVDWMCVRNKTGRARRMWTEAHVAWWGRGMDRGRQG